MDENKDLAEISNKEENNSQIVNKKVPLDIVDSTSDELIDRISKTNDKEELQSLYQQFNINNTKKNAIRVAELNQLLDKVNKEATERLTKRPEQISNKEMLDYMTAIGNQIERSQKIVDGIKDITAVQINNTHNTVIINMGDDTTTRLTKESRDKITNVISFILEENKKKTIIDADDIKSQDNNIQGVNEKVVTNDTDEDEGDN